MKTIIFLCTAIPMLLGAQDTVAPKINCQKIELQQMGSSFNTQNEKGELMVLIAAIEVKLSSRRCYEKGFRVGLPVAEKHEYRKPVFCLWDPVNQHWKKIDEPQKNLLMGGKICFYNKVKCPGLYAYMEKAGGNEKGIKLIARGKVQIRRVTVIQTGPDFMVSRQFDQSQKEIVIPTAELQFHARIRINYLLDGKEHEGEYLAGALTRIEENPDKEGYRVIKFNPSEIQSLTINH